MNDNANDENDYMIKMLKKIIYDYNDENVDDKVFVAVLLQAMLPKYIAVNCNEDEKKEFRKVYSIFPAILDPWMVSCYCTPGNHKRKYEK